MTDKEAFVSGIRLFCKTAGFDADDVAQVERLLLMHPDAAAPILKESKLTVDRVAYIRAGTLLKRAQFPPEVMQAASTGDYNTLINWAKQQQKQQQGGGWFSRFTQGIGRGIGQFAGAIQQGIQASRGTQPGADGTAGAGTQPAGTDDSHIKQYETDYETSPSKTQGMSKQRYVALRMQHALAQEQGQAFTPLEDFLAEQRSLTRSRELGRISRRSLRGYGIDMAPGQLAAMSDAEIQQRSEGDPGFRVSLTRARDLARTRERRQGGTAARMARGFTTQPAVAAASQLPSPVTGTPATPAPAAAASSTPPTSAESAARETAPPTSTAATPGSATPTPASTQTPIKPWSARGSFAGSSAIGSGGPAGTSSYEEV